MLINNNIRLKKSRFLFAYYIVSTLAAFFATFFIDLSSLALNFNAVFLLRVYILMVAAWFYYRYFSRYRIHTICLREAGGIDLISDHKTIKSSNPLASSRVLSWLVLLKFKGQRIMILPDTVDKDTFRQLKILLRYQC